MLSALIVALIFLKPVDINKKDACIYVKERALYLTDFKNTVELSKEIYEKSVSLSDVMKHIIVSEDGSCVFYPKKYIKNGYELCVKQLNAPKKSAVVVDKSVQSFAINKDGTVVTYIKGNNLYQSDLSVVKELATNVTEFYASADGQHIFYIDGKLNYIDSGKNKKTFDSIDKLLYSSADLSRVIYMNNGKLQEVADYNNAKVLAENVYDGYIYANDEECYFAVETALTLSDFISNSDSADYHNVRKALEEHQNSGNKFVNRTVYSYNYNSDSPKAVLESNVCVSAASTDINATQWVMWDDEKNYLVLYGYEDYTLQKTDIAQINDVAEFIDRMSADIASKQSVHLVKKGSLLKMQDITADCRYYGVSKDGKYFYAVGVEKDIKGNLYRFDISSGECGQSELYDEDVDSYTFLGDKIACFKKTAGQEYQLYVNQEFLIGNSASYCCLMNDGKSILGAAYNTEDASRLGLVIMTDDEMTVIGDLKSKPYIPSISFFLAEDDRVLWSSDYDKAANASTITLYRNGENKKIADGVEGVLYFDGKPTK